jgi:hypothetical protein
LQEVYRALSFSEIGKVWPDNWDLRNFIDKKSAELLEDSVGGLFGDMEREVASISLSIYRMGLDLETKFNDLYAHLQEFKTQTAIDENFVR